MGTYIFGLIGLTGALVASQSGDDLSPVLSLCDVNQGDQMRSEVSQSMDGFSLSYDAQCISFNSPDQGYQFCANPFFVAILADQASNNRFSCTASLPNECGTGCPLGTQCIYTEDYSKNTKFYSCGLVCGTGDTAEICSDAGAKRLNPNYVTYCDTISDQCGICSSAAFLSNDPATGGCAIPVTSTPAPPPTAPTSTTLTRKRAELAQLQLQPLQNAADLGCPIGIHKCGDDDSFECVDTMNDISSCGGCPRAGGVHCASLPGTVLGDTTCLSGKCYSTRCRPGFELFQGSCLLPDVAARLRNVTTTPTRVVDSNMLKLKSRKRDGTRYRITSHAQVKIKWWQTVDIVGDIVGKLLRR